MKLIECHIENFGKLQDETIHFKEGCNIFRKPNGWGKSTLAVFLRVMFFGFEGESKRKDLENERKRFRPWQGGVYGGSLVFETGGKRYRVSRIFGNKKQEDVFELREADSNLLSRDYSENLGEEIFAINSESFRRTVFLGQNDCVTHSTDSINAKLGNMTENMDDLDCYEKAVGRLREAQNRLTPHRKTGMIVRLNHEVTRLQTETAAGEALEEAMEKTGAQIREAQERLAALDKERNRLEQIWEQAGRAKEQSGRRLLYRQLCGEYEEEKAAVQKYRERFPGELPGEEELRGLLEACGRMEQAAQGMRLGRLKEEERQKIEDWERTAGTAQKRSGGNGAEKRTGGAERKETDASSGPGKLLLLMIPGMILAVCGGILCAGSHRLAGVALLAVGIIFVLLGAGMRRAEKNRNREKPEEQANAVREMEEVLYRDRRRQYEELKSRQETYETFCRRYVREQKLVQEGIWKMSLAPEADLKGQLQEIWENYRELQYCRKHFRETEKKKRLFEQENDMEQILSEEEKLPDLEELNRKRQLLEGEMEQCRNDLRQSEARMEELREKYDVWTEQKELLARTQEALDHARRQYRQLQKAQEYLTCAKENLTGRYMEPLMRRFSGYYRIILGEEPEQYQMDANTNLTVREQGMQRDTRCLSAGYQDLIGLCLRLSMADAMYQDEKPFLILDDPLVSLDDEKEQGAKRLLRKAAGEYQLIYFTCSESRAGNF